jgi:hypothetical protein
VLDVVVGTDWGGTPCFVETSFDVQSDSEDGRRIAFVKETRQKAVEGQSGKYEGTRQKVVHFDWRHRCYAVAPEDKHLLNSDLNEKCFS